MIIESEKNKKKTKTKKPEKPKGVGHFVRMPEQKCHKTR